MPFIILQIIHQCRQMCINITYMTQESWIKRYQVVISQAIKALSEYATECYNRLGYQKYYYDQLIMLCKKLQTKVKNKKDSNKYLSDAINWVTPKICSNCHTLMSKAKKYQKPPQPQQAINIVIKQLKLQQLLDRNDINQQQIMLVPIFIVKRVILYCRDYVQQLKNEQKYDKQLQYLNRAINIFDKFTLSLQSSYDAIQNRNIERDIIKQQYDSFDGQKVNRYRDRLRFLLEKVRLGKKKQKRAQDRKNAIFQLVGGEQIYIQGLQDYIKHVKKPIQTLKIISRDDIIKLFSTIEQIKQFHEIFKNQLKTMTSVYNPKQVYGEVIKRYIVYFKLYLTYIFNAESAKKLFIRLQNEHKEINEVAHEYYKVFKKRASDELLQPTFKIARYDMLMQQIIKNTEKTHVDYGSLREAQTRFKSMLTDVDKTVDRIARSNRYAVLDREFGTTEEPIEIAGREFWQEMVFQLIGEVKNQVVVVTCFTDLILIVDESTRKIIKRIAIDKEFFVRRDQNSKSYRNVITMMFQGGSVSLTAGRKDEDANKANDLYALLHKLSGAVSEVRNTVFATVLGTEEIGSTSFAKHTEFIVEVKYFGIKKFLHMRFSFMVNLVQDMQKVYENTLGITQEDSLKKNWFTNHKSKTIEDRKRILQRILHKMLNHPTVRNNPCHLLSYLGLPTNFFEVGRQSMEKRMLESKMASNCRLSNKEKKQAFTILCATEIELGNNLSHVLDPLLKKNKEEAKKTYIYVTVFGHEEPILVNITYYDTVEDVCNKVSKLIGLRSNRDFRLVHQIGKKQLRVLDHQQQIARLFKLPQKVVAPIAGFFSTVSQSIKKAFSPETYPTLIFKKYYYLPFEIQLEQARNDLTRLRLFVSQIFNEIKDMKYQLAFDEYLFFTALFIYIRKDDQIGYGLFLDEQEEVQKHIIEGQDVEKIIPESILKLKGYSEEEWRVRLAPLLKSIHRNIQAVIQDNKERVKKYPLKINSISKTALYFGYRHLCSLIVLNKIKPNPIFCSNLFYVQPHDTTYNEMKDKKLNVAYNMWLAVKVESLNLLSPSTKEVVLVLNYSDINDIQVYCQSVVLKMEHYIAINYRLRTYQSFEISQLIKYNKKLNEVMDSKLGDSELAIQVKQYCSEINEYRISYQGEY